MNLTREEWKERREMLRQSRERENSIKRRQDVIENLVVTVCTKYHTIMLEESEAHEDPDDLEAAVAERLYDVADALARNEKLVIEPIYKPRKSIAGYDGERLERR